MTQLTPIDCKNKYFVSIKIQKFMFLLNRLISKHNFKINVHIFERFLGNAQIIKVSLKSF